MLLALALFFLSLALACRRALPTAAQAPSQVLTLYDAGPVTLDPAQSQEMRSHIYVLQVFSGLVALDADLQVVPDIAESWEVSRDGLTYTFKLRRGVNFHSGREVRAGDFKYSWERALSPATASQTARTYMGDIVGFDEVAQGKETGLRGVEVADDYTLRVTIDAPRPYFLAKLTYPVAFVVDRENVQRGKEWWRQPNGTGPFKLKEWQPDQLLVLERNPSFYLGPPPLEQVIFRLWGGVPMSLYETGEIDVAEVSIADIDRVRDEANPLYQELRAEPQLSLYYIGFNARQPPFDDPLVRQAFSLAVDKERIIRNLFKGTVEPAGGFLPPGLPGFNPQLEPLQFDPQQARDLLQASRYKGRLPPITLTTAGEGEPIPKYLQAILTDWKQYLGITVTVRQLSPEVYFYRLTEEKDQLFSTGWVADYPDPHNFLDVLFHTGSEPNSGEYSNPEIDRLLERAGVERDPAQRLRLYQEIEQRLVEDAAALPLWFSTEYYLVKPWVKGYRLTPLGVPTLKEVYILPRQ